LTEADSHLGLTNRLLAPLARRVCLAFPIEGLDDSRYVLTGRPIPPPATDREAARARFGIGLSESCVLVFGGSQGARSINRAAVIPDRELTPARLAHEVGRLLADPGRLAAMAHASAALARPHAARDIAHELLAAARGG